MKHEFGSTGICKRCGCSQSAVLAFGFSCDPPPVEMPSKDFSADDYRGISESIRPTAEAEARRRQREEGLRAERQKAQSREFAEKLEAEAASKTLHEVQMAIEGSARAGRRTCTYSLDDLTDRQRTYTYPGFFGHKRTMRRKDLPERYQAVYDCLKGKGFAVEILNTSAPRGLYWVMKISW